MIGQNQKREVEYMRSKALLFSNIYSTVLVSILSFVFWMGDGVYIFEELFEIFYYIYDVDVWLECFIFYLPATISIAILPILGVILGWVSYEKQSSKLAFASAIMYIFPSTLICLVYSYELDVWGWLLGSFWVLFAFVGYCKQKELEK